MVDEATKTDVSTLGSELEQALSTLDSALADASRSVSTVRASVAQLLKLAEQAHEMKAAIARAREQLTVSFDSGSALPPLRAVPIQEPARELVAPEPEPDESIARTGTADESPVLTPESVSTTPRCLRLGVISKAGSLDLKEVDGSVNENPAVTDVALLDYDGRQATLKLWINEEADADRVREDLLSSLRNHLGDGETELTLDFEEGTAA